MHSLRELGTPRVSHPSPRVSHPPPPCVSHLLPAAFLMPPFTIKGQLIGLFGLAAEQHRRALPAALQSGLGICTSRG